MGAYCCNQKKEMLEPSISLSTVRVLGQSERANEMICNSLMRFDENPFQCSLIEESPNRSFKNKLSRHRVLTEKELKSIDLGFFLCYDDFSTIDLSKLIEGVYSAPNSVFELENKSIYKGEFDIDGLQHGRGMEIRPNGSKFMGYFYHGKIKGLGRLINAEGILYQGNFETIEAGTRCDENAVLDGIGKELWPNGIKYEGEFSMGNKEGKGILYLKGCKYVGDFKDNEINGEGTMVWDTKKKYQGHWKNGLMHGSGVFSWPNGKVYQGEYRKGFKSGVGFMKWPDGKKYQGTWKNGKQHGQAIYTFFDSNKNRLRSCRSEWSQGSRVRWLST